MPTTRTRRRQARRGTFPPWISEALRTGRSAYSLEVALGALRQGRSDPVAARNRVDDHRLDVAVLRVIWREFGAVLLDAHVRQRPGTRPVAWWYWDQGEVRIEAGTTVEEIEQTIGNQADWLRQHGYLTSEEA